MPKCQKCYKFYPPQFTVLIKGTEDHQCIFCRDNVDYIMYDDENGDRIKYTKKECEEDYKKYIKMVREKNKVLLEEKRLNLKE